MEAKWIKVADYAEIRGVSKQAIYQAKRIKRTKLPDGSQVIMLDDIPIEDLNAVNQFLANKLTNKDNDSTTIKQVESTAENAAKIAKLEAEAESYKAQLEYVQISSGERIADLKNEIRTLNEQISKKDDEINRLHILMAQKIPDAKQHRTFLQLLPWNRHKGEDEA